MTSPAGASLTYDDENRRLVENIREAKRLWQRFG